MFSEQLLEDRPFTARLWEGLNISLNRLEVLQPDTNYDIEELHFNCVAPSVHPYSARGLQELFGVLRHVRPMSHRRRILWASRTRMGFAVNGGRQVVNEDQLLEVLQVAAQSENMTVEFFDLAASSSVPAMVAYLADVWLLIGPHGGALFNLMPHRRAWWWWSSSRRTCTSTLADH